MDYLHIGGTPADESCAQLGVTQEFSKLNRLECKAYIAALRKKYGIEPEGASLALRGERHDFGNYSEVVCRYDESKPEAVEYAEKVEAGLATWLEVKMWPPVTYDGSTPVLVLEDEALWDMEANPRCMSTVERMNAAKEA